MSGANSKEADGMVKNVKGFSLVELIIVMVIMGVLLTIGIISFKGMQQRGDVEQKVKKLYADLMEARLRAVQRGRVHFVYLSTGAAVYTVYEDGPAPDGDGNPNVGTDTLISTQSIAPYTLVMSAVTMTLVQFNSKGLVSSSSSTGWARISATSPGEPGEYDCILIDKIKTGMGQMNGTNCIVK